VNGIARVVFDTNILFSSVGWLGNPYHCVQAARNGEGANFFCNLGCLLGVKAALELKLLGKFSKDGFAGEGQALTVKGGLNAVIWVSQPANRGKKDIRVEDDSGNAVHD